MKALGEKFLNQYARTVKKVNLICRSQSKAGIYIFLLSSKNSLNPQIVDF